MLFFFTSYAWKTITTVLKFIKYFGTMVKLSHSKLFFQDMKAYPEQQFKAEFSCWQTLGQVLVIYY